MSDVSVVCVWEGVIEVIFVLIVFKNKISEVVASPVLDGRGPPYVVLRETQVMTKWQRGRENKQWAGVKVWIGVGWPDVLC